MKFIKLYIILITLLSSVAHTIAQTLNEMCELSLPVMIINTVNEEMPTCNFIEAPKGSNGTTICDETKVHCSVTIRLHDNIIYESGDYKDDKSGATIKIRGNSSAQSNPKPYKIKLEKKADLLNRGNDKKYKDKEWLLLRASKLRSYVGFTLNKIIDMPYKPEFKPINVFINNKYHGLYYLTESINRNDKCRIDVDKKKGYIFEYDAYWWARDYYIPLENGSKKMGFTLKYPDEDDIKDDKKSYLEQFVKDLQESMTDGHSKDYLDVDICARWMVAHDLLGTADGAGTNLYFVKKNQKEEVKAYTPVLWDFSAICQNEGEWSSSHKWEEAFFHHAFDKGKNDAFVEAYCKEWLNMSNNRVAESLIDSLHKFANSEEGVDFEKSRRLHNLIYDRSDSLWSISAKVKEYEDWFTARQEWMDTNIDKEFIHIMRFLKYGYVYPDVIYDILGRRINGSHKAVKIIDGKKYLELY